MNYKRLVWSGMFTFLGLMTSFASFQARADRISLVSLPHGYDFVATEYRFFPVAGHAARLEVLYNEELGDSSGDVRPHGGGGPRTRHHVEEVLVPGLSYGANSEIVFEGQSGKVICAKTHLKENFLGRGMHFVIEPTGECRTVTLDEGGAVTVYFETN